MTLLVNSEIFPKDLYSIYRKDRTGRKEGGVFLAISTDILSSEQPELDTDCEITWAKVDIIGVKSHRYSNSGPPFFLI